MSKKKVFKWLALSVGVLSLLALLLVGNVSSASSDSKYSKSQLELRDEAIKTFDIDTSMVKPLFSRDIFDDMIAEESSEIRNKSAAALAILTKEGLFRPGDFRPVYFLEGENKVSIAIKHSDGSISLDEFEISGKEPIKTNRKIKEVK